MLNILYVFFELFHVPERGGKLIVPLNEGYSIEVLRFPAIISKLYSQYYVWST